MTVMWLFVPSHDKAHAIRSILLSSALISTNLSHKIFTGFLPSLSRAQTETGQACTQWKMKEAEAPYSHATWRGYRCRSSVWKRESGKRRARSMRTDLGAPFRMARWIRRSVGLLVSSSPKILHDKKSSSSSFFFWISSRTSRRATQRHFEMRSMILGEQVTSVYVVRSLTTEEEDEFAALDRGSIDLKLFAVIANSCNFPSFRNSRGVRGRERGGSPMVIFCCITSFIQK